MAPPARGAHLPTPGPRGPAAVPSHPPAATSRLPPPGRYRPPAPPQRPLPPTSAPPQRAAPQRLCSAPYPRPLPGAAREDGAARPGRCSGGCGRGRRSGARGRGQAGRGRHGAAVALAGGLRSVSPLGSEGCPRSRGGRGGGSGVGTVVSGGLRAGSAVGGCGGSWGSGWAMSAAGREGSVLGLREGGGVVCVHPVLCGCSPGSVFASPWVCPTAVCAVSACLKALGGSPLNFSSGSQRQPRSATVRGGRQRLAAGQ